VGGRQWTSRRLSAVAARAVVANAGPLAVRVGEPVLRPLLGSSADFTGGPSGVGRRPAGVLESAIRRLRVAFAGVGKVAAAGAGQKRVRTFP